MNETTSSLVTLFLVGLVLLLTWYSWQQSKMAKIFEKEHDEFEDQVYRIASLGMSLSATARRLLRVTSEWSASEHSRLILRNKDASFQVFTLDGTKITQDGTSFSAQDFASLSKLFAKKTARRFLTVRDLSLDQNTFKMLQGYNISYILPLRFRNQVEGFLTLGRDDAPLDKYKIAEISASHNGFVVALESARNRDDLLELNAKLDREVKGATQEVARANRQLTKFDQAKDDFIAMTSNQLRTPLTSIKGYLSLVLEGDLGELNAEQKRALSQAYRSSETMTCIVADFLNLSRLQVGRFNFNKKPSDLVDLVQAEFKLARSSATLEDIKLSLKIEDSLPKNLRLDEHKTRQAISNLINNAIRYSKAPAKVSVNLLYRDGLLDFFVKDEGIGVPIAERDRLFERFFRSSLAKKQVPGGSGVGLYIAKEIIEGHGGQIYYLPNTPKGSIFGFCLPVDKKLNPEVFGPKIIVRDKKD